MTLWAPDDADLGDATNYLGGIGDVLQAKRPLNVALAYLGELATVAVYADDRQIREMVFRHIVSTKIRYRLRFFRLPPS